MVFFWPTPMRHQYRGVCTFWNDWRSELFREPQYGYQYWSSTIVTPSENQSHTMKVILYLCRLRIDCPITTLEIETKKYSTYVNRTRVDPPLVGRRGDILWYSSDNMLQWSWNPKWAAWKVLPSISPVALQSKLPFVMFTCRNTFSNRDIQPGFSASLDSRCVENKVSVLVS